MRLALSLGILSGTNVFLAALIQWYVLVTIGPGVETDALFAGTVVPRSVLAMGCTHEFDRTDCHGLSISRMRTEIGATRSW